MAFQPGESITIPSPIDVHAHLREPGGTDKETIASGTYAALKGGYQAVFDMPNNPGGMQTWSEERLDEKYEIGAREAHTDIGFYAGVDLAAPAIDEIPKMIGKAAGLKLYFGHTTGTTEEFVLDHARETIDTWVSEGSKAEVEGYPPILLHAREGVGEEVARYIARANYPVHWCHVATETEANMAEDLRESFGGNFTAGVTPHHLTMTDRDADLKYGWYGARMMPPLGPEADSEALLDALQNGRIQIIETDHAPHTDADKQRAEEENPEGHDDVDCTTCFGISGIEFVLPVMMSLVQRNKLSMERLVDALHTQPAQMLGLENRGSAETTIDVGPYVIGENDRVGMSKNNPYVGWTAWGKVARVVVGGQVRLFKDGSYGGKTEARVLKPGMEV